MGNETWRFPGNNFTKDEGLDTADMETFKKDALSSLARELCQNSIDAKIINSTKPVRIVFKLFEIDRNDIPQIDLLEKQIVACKETWGGNKKISDSLSKMENCIKQEKITCLRVSDFNTTGLTGVNTGGDNNAWHYLVHGSGLSNKSGTSGGSKGIGKYAAFVASQINTVFYSTKTITGEEGYEGICKLCSAKQPNTEEKTLGIGYFGSDDRNRPICGQLSLDKGFERNESGSDIVIAAFKAESNWKRDIISKILESFIVAFAYGTLEVEVDGTLISRDTLKDLVYDENLIKKELKKSVISQYMLLTDPNTKVDVINIDDYGEIKLYTLELSGELESFATSKVTMVRYPYMKIKDTQKLCSIPFSAMCIIGDNNLNKILRDIENPQHTDWETKRIDDESKRAELQSVIKDLIDKMRTTIVDHLSTSDNSKTDLEGAGEYLPGFDENKAVKPNNDKKIIKDKPEIKKKVRTKKSNINASIESDVGDGILLDIGGDAGEEETVVPEGNNRGSGGPIKPGPIPDKSGIGDDGSIIQKTANLRSMQYKLICIDRKNGTYVICFDSDYSEKEVMLEVFSVDDGGKRYSVAIKKALVNGVPSEVENEKTVKFAILKGIRYKVEIYTDQKELFSGEVKVYAYR